MGHSTRTPIDVIDADLATVAASADQVIRIHEDPMWLLHLEPQSSHETDFPERVNLYNTLLGYRHRLRVRSVMLLLRPAANSPHFTGLYQEQFLKEPAYRMFRYYVLRLWQLPVEQFHQGGLGTLPLALLADAREDMLSTVLHRVDERLRQEAAPEQIQLLGTATFLLAGLRLAPDQVVALFQGVAFMNALRESSSYQMILNERRAEEARTLLLQLGAKRFGPPTADIKDRLEAITDVARLERIGQGLLDVNNWEELLAIA
ncbi:MAG: hypothetical protein ACK4RK_21210 [Gemmataceae bacterium]